MSAKAFDDLKNQVKWDVLLEKHSKGSLYRALEEYDPLMQERYKQIIERVTKVQEEERLVHERLKTKNEEQEQLEITNQGLRECNAQLTHTRVQLEEELALTGEKLQSESAKLYERENALKALDERGLTSEFLTETLESDIESSAEYIRRVKTSVEFEKVQEDKKQVENELTKFNRESEQSKAHLENIHEETRSAQNQLDQLKSQNVYWLDALSIAVHCFEQGYTASVLIGVLNALLRLGIKGEPLASARRLIGGLEKMKELLDLEDSVIRTSAQLRTLKGELAETQGTLASLRKDVLGNISEAKNKAVQNIDAVTAKAQRSVSDLVNSLKNVETKSIESIANLEKETEDVLSAHQQDISKFFINNSFAIQLAINTYSTRIQQYADLKEQLGEMQPWIEFALILYGTTQDPQSLQRVNLSVVRRICEGIHLYLTGRWPSARIRVPREISDKEFGMITGSEFSLPSVSALLVEGLRRLEREGNR